MIPPYSVNIPITRICNYNCRFCFGCHESLKEHYKEDRILEIPSLLKEGGCDKVTFEGGEPFLSPFLSPLLYLSKKEDLTTSIVTNGSMITKQYLDLMSPYLDWIGISIDSQHDQIEEYLGRGGKGHTHMVKEVSNWCHELSVKLKINTVVTSCTYKEDMTDLIRELKPARWKAFQVLKVKEENDIGFDDMEISTSQFQEFIDINSKVEQYGIPFISEFNDQMDRSYVMILPDGHFFNYTDKGYVASKDSIFDVGVEKALSQVDWDSDSYFRRKGYYDWRNNKKEVITHG
mgnify:CR=1 FL=1